MDSKRRRREERLCWSPRERGRIRLCVRWLMRTSTPRGKAGKSEKRGAKHELYHIWYRIQKRTMWRSSIVDYWGSDEIMSLLLLLFALLLLPLLLTLLLLLLLTLHYFLLLLLLNPRLLTLPTWILHLLMLTLIELLFLRSGLILLVLLFGPTLLFRHRCLCSLPMR